MRKGKKRCFYDCSISYFFLVRTLYKHSRDLFRVWCFKVMLTNEPEMKYIVATIYSNYTTTIVDDTGIEQVDAYTAPPKNDKLIIRLERV